MSVFIAIILWSTLAAGPTVALKFYFHLNRKRKFPDYPWSFWFGTRCSNRRTTRRYGRDNVRCNQSKGHETPHGIAPLTIASFWRGTTDIGFQHPHESEIKWYS